MSERIDARACLGRMNVLFITLDALRFDVAASALAAGRTPVLRRLLPGGVWERRHSPSSFTYGAHHAFFAGFLPTPVRPRAEDPVAHERLFAAAFEGSETAGARTLIFQEASIVEGFAAAGYHTICIGGVGFFNKRTALGSALPSLFAESHWEEAMGVAARASTERQVERACARLAALPPERRFFLFVNVSACHQPTHFYLDGAAGESVASQRAALAYADSCLPPLLEALAARGDTLAVICSDHGSAFGEDGHQGHRLGHPVVWETPYMETILPGSAHG